MHDDMSVPDLAIASLMHRVHDLMHRLDAFAYSIEMNRTDRKLRAGERLDHAAAALLAQLRSVHDAGRDVLRASSTAPAASDATPNPVRVGGTPLNVLWVDDDALHLSSLGGHFQDAMWRVTPPTTVDEALNLVAREDFDAVIVDLIMPHGALTAEEGLGID